MTAARAYSLPSLDEVQKELAERKLHHFIRQGWRQMDPAPYIHNWHIEVIGEHLEAVTAGEINRLLINIPPRCIKSISCAVALPAWTWAQERKPGQYLRGPQVRWMFSSYAHTLSIRDSVKCRRLIESPWYQRRWGKRFQLADDQNTKIKFENDKGGYRLSTSVDGTNTGDGGDIIVIDDPHNATEVQSDAEIETVLTWWREGMSTRLNDPKHGAYIMIMQRLSDRDLAGHILAKETGWTHLCLPMEYERKHPYVYGKDPRKKERELLWPERIGPEELEQMKSTLGSYGTAGQMQQRPAPQEGGMFKRDWFEIVGAIPVGSRCARAWDLAASDKEQGTDPDSTAGGRMWRARDKIFYIDQIIYEQRTGLAILNLIKQTAVLDGKGVPIFLPQDPGQAGKSQVESYIQQLAGWVVISHVMSGSKEARAKPWAIQAEAGNVKLVATGDKAQDAWIEKFLQSAVIFPNGRKDDDIDCISDCFETLLLEIPVPVAAPVGVEMQSPYPI